MEITEEFFTGYCKTNNTTQTVICEYEQSEAEKKLLNVSCYYPHCLHAENCELIRQITKGGLA